MNNAVIKFTSLMLVMSLLFSSCATTKDGRVTQAQGTGGGAVLGALLGAALGAATGDYNSIAKYAAIGAAAGAVAGFAYGTNVAKKKASYAKQEDFLDFAIAQADKDNQVAVKKNQQLLAEVEKLESQYGKLAAADAKAKTKLDKTATKQSEALNQQSVALDTRIKDYNECLTGDGYGNKTQSSTLRTKIQSLETEKAAIQKYQKRLAAAQTRIAI